MRKSHQCRRCGRPYVTKGTEFCVHVRVTDVQFNAIEGAMRDPKEKSE